MTIRCSCSSGHDEEKDWCGDDAAVVALLKCCKHSKHPLRGDCCGASGSESRSAWDTDWRAKLQLRLSAGLTHEIAGKLRAKRGGQAGGAGPDIDMQQGQSGRHGTCNVSAVCCVGDRGGKNTLSQPAQLGALFPLPLSHTLLPSPSQLLYK